MSRSQWINLIGYQIVWLIVVTAAGRGLPWVAIAATSTFVAAHLLLSRQWPLDLQLLAVGLSLGLLSDGGLAWSGFLSYASAGPALPPGGAPLWILTLWAAFAVTLNRSLAWVQRRPWVAVLFGLIGGPLAYLSASRGWDAVQFVPPASRALGWLAMSWGIAMYLFARVINRAKGCLPGRAVSPTGSV
jgi:hypothetical protein